MVFRDINTVKSENDKVVIMRANWAINMFREDLKNGIKITPTYIEGEKLFFYVGAVLTRNEPVVFYGYKENTKYTDLETDSLRYFIAKVYDGYYGEIFELGKGKSYDNIYGKNDNVYISRDIKGFENKFDMSYCDGKNFFATVPVYYVSRGTGIMSNKFDNAMNKEHNKTCYY